eukprot:g1217.t1
MELQTQALVAYGEPLQHLSRPLPALKGTEVLVKTTHAGCCHSELHLWEGYFDLGDGRKLRRKPLTEPRTLGHEIEGTVVACGPDVPSGLFDDPNKPYAVYPWIGCEKRTCVHCRTDDTYNLCQARGSASKKFVDGETIYGGYASHSVVPHWKYLLDYEGALPPGLGCVYMCSGLTAFGALKKVQRHPGIVDSQDVLILGLGGLGFQALGFSVPMLGGPPLVADIDEAKLAHATELVPGTTAFNSKDKRAIKEVRAASFDGTGIGAVIDFVGNEATANFAEKVLRKGGKYVLCGLFGGMQHKPLIMLPLMARCQEGSFVGSFEEAKEMIEVLRRGGVALPPHHFTSIMNANESLRDLKAGKIVGRRIFVHDWKEHKEVKGGAANVSGKL